MALAGFPASDDQRPRPMRSDLLLGEHRATGPSDLGGRVADRGRDVGSGRIAAGGWRFASRWPARCPRHDEQQCVSLSHGARSTCRRRCRFETWTGLIGTPEPCWLSGPGDRRRIPARGFVQKGSGRVIAFGADAASTVMTGLVPAISGDHETSDIVRFFVVPYTVNNDPLMA